MNSKLVLVSALAAGAMTAAGMAQTAGPQVPSAPASTPAPATTQAPPPPQAIPAKVALIEFEQVAEATNEGQKAAEDLQKKYEPQRVKLEALKTEIESLTKQLQNAPATMTDEDKASRARVIDTKQKQLQRDADDAQTAFGTEMQDAIAKVAQKLGPVVIKYVQQNGYTLLLDNAPQLDANGQQLQGGLRVLWAPGTDISQAVVDAYNAASGVAAPTPSAPSATRPRPTTPRSTTPNPTAPKQ
jgi:Skp family chaperone for outer membrane proteins